MAESPNSAVQYCPFPCQPANEAVEAVYCKSRPSQLCTYADKADTWVRRKQVLFRQDVHERMRQVSLSLSALPRP